MRLNNDNDVENNQQFIEDNQPQEANNNKNCGNCPKITSLSLLPFFVVIPYFKILKTNSDHKKVFYFQIIFALISSFCLIACIIYMFVFLINSVQEERFRWVALLIIILSIVFFVFLIKIWFWSEKLEN